jgi:CheY-like chemotaxis protein
MRIDGILNGETHERQERAEDMLNETNKKTAVVLVIDDEETITGLVKTILTKEGYTVHEASSGLEGVTTAMQVRPDLILMDITMPDIDGYEATSQIKQYPSLKNVPIVFLSGKSASEDGGRAFATGGLTYMRKPFTAQQLKDLVALALLSV